MHYAHSRFGSDQSNWEPLAVHLNAVAKGAEGFAATFGAGDWGHVAGLLHDLGKYSDAFQRRLKGEVGKVDHATAGAIEAGKLYGYPLARPLQFVIAGHHAGLADGRVLAGGSVDQRARSTLEERLSRTIEDYRAFDREIAVPNQLPPLPLSLQRHRCGFQLALFTRMLFSCLVDADFLETERFYNDGVPREAGDPDLSSLKAMLDAHLRGMEMLRPETDINVSRRAILEACRSAADKDRGLFSLTVPTGGGKTLSSLAFALDHAIRHGLERVIYVIPFTSIIEQNAAVFKDVLGDDAVLEHHSAFRDEKERDPNGDDSRSKLKLAAENWDAPVVVTTTVQFFESLFAARSSRCRKLHNIAGSVVILDEAQSLPLPILRPCVAMIDELARNYRTSLVLCTATQPVLIERPEDPERSFAGGLKDVREIMPDPAGLYRAFKRVRTSDIGEIDDGDLAERLRGHDQALCIVNSRGHAHALFETLGSDDGHLHLSALMCPAHRSERLNEIRQRLADKRRCIVISTSLVEAGVDLDFPTVYRAETGLDSLAQAAGRCNREGRLQQGEVFLFRAKGHSPKGEMDRRATAARSVLRRQGADPLSPDAIEAFFGDLYWSETGEGLDKYDLLALLEGTPKEMLLPFETVARLFRMIESDMLPVIIPRGETARALIDELKQTDRVGQIARKLQPYIVQLHEGQFAKLRDAGAVQPVNPDRFGEQFHALVSEGLYRDDVGLTLDDPTFRRVDENMF